MGRPRRCWGGREWHGRFPLPMDSKVVTADRAPIVRGWGRGGGRGVQVMLGEWLGTAVAVKRYVDDPAQHIGAVDEFRAEFAALSSLIHPKVRE